MVDKPNAELWIAYVIGSRLAGGLLYLARGFLSSMSLYTHDYLMTKGATVERMAFKSAATILEKAADEFSAEQRFDVFLSHSYADATVIVGVRQELLDMDFSVFVDWIDEPQLDRAKVTSATAEGLRAIMKACGSLLYAVSDNSPKSVWMPWEMGYFDGIAGRVAILPITDQLHPEERRYRGQEYLGLYPYISKYNSRREEVTLWVNQTPDDYVSLRGWLQGDPFRHDSSWRGGE